ncbi:MAG: transposase [Patescibacteria group bacterium]|nr:transposase [Patescibacteria group bacterium]
MSTPIRLDLPNFPYHVYCRGNNKNPIFYEPEDYRRFLTKLKEYKDDLRVKIHAYSLMPNHFHLLAEPLKTGTRSLMHPLMTSYAKYFSLKYDFVGHIFQGRFQSLIIDKDNYFLAVSKYIHLNAMESGFIKNPYDYEWSSCKAFLTDAEDSLVAKNDTLSYFSQDIPMAIIKYKEFILSKEKTCNPFTEAKRGILGNKRFVWRISKILGKRI